MDNVLYAGVMELADVTDSKSVDGDIVWVRVPPPAPKTGDTPKGYPLFLMIRLDSPQFYLPLTLCKAFRLEADTADGTMVLPAVDHNASRAYHVEVGRDDATVIRLIPLENYGGSGETRMFSFDFR